ncbi:trypsin-like [Garra rufa]|uniref:trypsin-like n=1 Tax=Garra rufa TaxID=137080 RepID=UPI003CCEF443
MMLRLAVCVAGVLLLNIAGSLCQLDVCGQAPLKPKIVGGQDAVEGSWPWQASINYASTEGLICGGSLINKDWVLSAAQCFVSIPPSSIKIYLGRHRRIGENPNEISRNVIQIINHPKYDPDTHDNDIALVKLSSSVTFNDYISPICLAAAGSTFAEDTESWVTGWGTLSSEGNNFATILQEVMIPVVSKKACNSAYANSITDNMLCAGLTEGGKDSCKGDGGGPMVHNNGSHWFQSGIASFGIGCALPTFPGVYTKVSEYQDWISSQIRSNLPGFVEFKNSGFRSSTSLPLFCLSLTFSTVPIIFSQYPFC